MNIPIFYNTSFKGLRPGDFVKYLIPNGLSIKDGKAIQDWKQKRSKIVMVFENHVVVNGGGRYGTPHVVDAHNYVE